MELWKRRLIYFSVFVVIFILIGLCGYGVAVFNKDCRELGEEYGILAMKSPDIDNAIIYLEKYREAVEKNGFTSGSNARFFKTLDNDMAYRYEKLVVGINYLKQLKAQTGINDDMKNFKAMTSIPEYVESLDMDIDNYLTANNLGRLFQSGWNFIIVIFLPFWWLFGLWLLFPDNSLFF